ncbi:hypothetical protein BN1708_020671, partial [Verticillium longisporum]
RRQPQYVLCRRRLARLPRHRRRLPRTPGWQCRRILCAHPPGPGQLLHPQHAPRRPLHPPASRQHTRDFHSTRRPAAHSPVGAR